MFLEHDLIGHNCVLKKTLNNLFSGSVLNIIYAWKDIYQKLTLATEVI